MEGSGCRARSGRGAGMLRAAPGRPVHREAGDAHDAQPQLRRDPGLPRRRGAGTGGSAREARAGAAHPAKSRVETDRQRRRGPGITPTPTRGVPTCAPTLAAASAKHVPGAAARTAAPRLPRRRAAPWARGAAVAAAAGWPARGRGAAQVNLSRPPRPGVAAAPAVANASLRGWRWQPAPSRRGLSCFCCHCCPLSRPRGLSL